jgi:rhamnosyltransferase
MISVVIRNKNEADYLERILAILTNRYTDDINEIIIVDNNSSDDSIVIAQKYQCKIVTIDKFTYGKAINLGIQATKNDYVLLLSSHAIPIGKRFFKNTIEFIQSKKDFAGLRYINSIENYERAISNDFKVKQPLQYGLMAACCIVSKVVWSQYLFNEELVFSEDKEWSERVSKAGYGIYEIDEAFFYFIKRREQSELNRFKNETIAKHQLHNIKYISKTRIIGSLLKKIMITNSLNFFRIMKWDLKMAKKRFEISNILRHNKFNL